jgi:serine/threonine protein kinase
LETKRGGFQGIRFPFILPPHFLGKVIRWISGGAQSPNAEREVAILQLLRHPQIMILMGVCRDLNPTEGSIGLIFELMESGSLYDLLHGVSEDALMNRPSDLISKLNLCLDIADGMCFLHNSMIIHRDLKSANVLIGRDGRCKIADFGLSTLKDSSSATQTPISMTTPSWTDPEVALGANFSKASDMYSFGVIVWEIFSGKIPWDGMPLLAISTQVAVQGQRLELQDSFPPLVKGFLSSCFGESLKRPNFSHAIDIFQDFINYLQSGRQQRATNSIPSREEFKEIMEEAMGDMELTLAHVNPHHSLKQIESQIKGLKDISQIIQNELNTIPEPEGSSRLTEFWILKMKKLETLIRSSVCDEGKIIKEIRILGASLSVLLLELDLKIDPEVVIRELNKVCDRVIQAQADKNEMMLNGLLEELKRVMII